MTEHQETAILAGGCFWGVQDLIRKQPGVISTRVGYTGGDIPDAIVLQPRRPCRSHRDHLRSRADPRIATCSSSSSRSTTPRRRNRQGNDVGDSYRSAIFYTTDEQRKVAEDTIADVDAFGPLARKSRHRGHARRSFRRQNPSIRTTSSDTRTATRATSSGRTGSSHAAPSQRPPDEALSLVSSSNTHRARAGKIVDTTFGPRRGAVMPVVSGGASSDG